jgi:hypothetical protein
MTDTSLPVRGRISFEDLKKLMNMERNIGVPGNFNLSSVTVSGDGSKMR